MRSCSTMHWTDRPTDRPGESLITIGRCATTATRLNNYFKTFTKLCSCRLQVRCTARRLHHSSQAHKHSCFRNWFLISTARCCLHEDNPGVGLHIGLQPRNPTKGLATQRGDMINRSSRTEALGCLSSGRFYAEFVR